jgi:hypothetical protein
MCRAVFHGAASRKAAFCKAVFPEAAFRRGVEFVGVAMGAVLALVGCGDDGAAPPDPQGSVEETGPSFSVEGRGSSNATSGVMQVWEGEPAVELSLRGVDAAGNLVLLYVTFDGVESVSGAHTFEIGLPGETNVSGIGILEDQVYYSLRGELQVEMSGAGHADGQFEMDLAFDDGSGPPPGVPSEAIEPALSLSGSFKSEWTLDCRSRLVGFTGGHYTHDSPYCQGLTL